MNEATTFGDEKFEGRPAGHEGKAFRKALELCWTERAHISSFIDSGMRRDGHAPRAGEIVFKLGILPPDDPEDFKITPNTLNSEFATKYLEQIGVKPSKQTMEMVHKSIPLTPDQIKTTLRAKGHVSDEVIVTCPKVQHSAKVASPISAFSFAQLTLSSNEQRGEADGPASSLPDIRVEMSPRGTKATKGTARLTEPAVEPGSIFRDLASKYLYPFNINSSGPVDTSHPRVTIKKDEGGELKSSFWGGLSSDFCLIDGVSAEEEIAEELVQELIVTPEPILMILVPLEAALVEWYKAQSADTVARLPYEDFKEGINLVTSDSTIKFYTTMINLLHDQFVKGSQLYSSNAESKMKRQSLMRREASAKNSFASEGNKSFLGRSGRSGRMGSSMRGLTSGPQGENTTPSASTSISRPMALQQYDLGYKIFVKERMLEIAESEDAQRELLDREKVKSKGGGLISLAPVADIERGSIEGSITASSRMTSVAGRSAVPDDKGRMSPSASKSEYHRVNASIPPGGSCRGSIARPGRFEDGSNGGMATSLRRSTDKAAEGKHSSSSGGGAEGNGRVRVPRVPGLAGEPLLTDVHPLVQTAIKNLNSAHALTAASMARAILESLDANDLEYLQQVRLFSLQKEFAAIYQEQRTTRVGLFFSLPIFLMFLRLSIQTLFSTNYPLWTRTKDGQESLASMDKVCCDLLDPHRYLERNLSILQSSPAAIDVIARNPSKGHEAESYHFTDTSRLLRSALLSPSSAATRRILVAQSQKDALKPQGKKQMLASKKLSTQLTFEQREELYQDARMLLETRKNLPAAAARKK